MEEEVIQRALLADEEKERREKNIQQIKNKLAEVQENNERLKTCKARNKEFWQTVKKEEIEKRIDEFSLPKDLPKETALKCAEIRQEYILKIMNQASKDIEA